MPDLVFELVDEAGFEAIPSPSRPGARCQTCDYWERLEGSRDAPEVGARDIASRRSLKVGRVLAGVGVSGSYAMLAYQADAAERRAIGYAQFGPLSAYPRAQSIRDRYPELPESPAPWVVTCLQIVADTADRNDSGAALLDAVCRELDGRGITAVEAYPEAAGDPWTPSPGPAAVYEAAGFGVTAFYPVSREWKTWRVLEFDCVMARPAAL